jgi:hypothetical protein
MVLRRASHRAFRQLACCRHVSDQASHEPGQIEAIVESLGEAAEVAGHVLGEVEVLVGAVDHSLEVAERGANPLEPGDLAGLATAHCSYEPNRQLNSTCAIAFWN